ncbi:hypothetical protein P9112_002966 [Eukaryota sp. TZLM1-RC]
MTTTASSVNAILLTRKDLLQSKVILPSGKVVLPFGRVYPPPEESSTSLVKNAPPTEKNIGDHTYDPNNILPNERKLPLDVRNQQLPSKVTEGDGEHTSYTDPPPSPSEEAHEDSSSVTVTSAKTGTPNPNDGTGDGDGDKPPTDPSDIQWTETEIHTFPKFYCQELKKRVTHTVRDFFQSIIASPPDDIRDWSDDKFVAAIQNKSNIIVDFSCIEEMEEFLMKRWLFLFGSSRGYTQDDLVLEQQDQEVDFVKRLDQCSESSVNFVA